MSERLRLLQRQQALLREHLAWIEDEIAREAAPAATLVPTLTTSASPSPPDADVLIERYASDERHNPDDVRRGCLLTFIAALLLTGVGVLAIWLVFYR